MESNTALVLGATGGIGGEMARQLRDAGWTVRALRRSGEQQIERRDAMNREDVLAAAEGCSVIVHAVNPPGYRRWGELVLPMLDNTIAAAHANGATIVLPGTVYNYGPSSFPTLHEDSPQQPITRKGSIRVEMEQRLKQASSQNCRVLLVRAGDFFGPKLGSSWFSQGMLKPGQPVKSISVPNAPGMGHQWSYLPDVARTMVELLQLRSTLDPFAAFHTAGHWDADGTQLAEAICRVVVKRGGVKPKVRAFPWWLTVLRPLYRPCESYVRCAICGARG
ncbi:NAD-dependent epimerase/dehydratase family protein [Aeromonas veronii]|uniref:NAD-dependent epimerase/dehydratase family protein n=1 Tax=Aeromonas veronii TaxID=654 RepID=UPI001D07925F|nr:NAD-dependent epimerase/dehydratase family protein [Aeromonas veronii]